MSFDPNKLRGIVIEIYPTDEQKKLIHRTIEIYRAVYNLAINIHKQRYEELGKSTSYYTMAQIFSDMRNNDLNYSWLNEIPIGTIRQALIDVNRAYEKFFKGLAKYPKYKSRKRSKKFFIVRSERTHAYDDYVNISGIGMVYGKNHTVPLHTRLYHTQVTYDGYGRYYFSCQIERDTYISEEHEKSDVVGVDVGVRNMITTSDGEFYHMSDTSFYEKRLKRQRRRLSKHYKKYLEISVRTTTKYDDIPKSKNMQKLLYKQHKTIEKIKNKRHNDINVATKRIVDKNPSTIVIEDIRVTRILSSQPWMKKYSSSMCFYEIRRQLEYKAADRGIKVIVADEHYPSSQICSRCGNIHKVYHDVYKCPLCGLRIDRDLNAAYNLRNLAYQNVNSAYEVA